MRELGSISGALKARRRHACQMGFGGKRASGRGWTSQRRCPGALGHDETAVHALEKEDKVHSTVSARQEGGHHGHSRPHGTQDQSNMSGT